MKQVQLVQVRVQNVCNIFLLFLRVYFIALFLICALQAWKKIKHILVHSYCNNLRVNSGRSFSFASITTLFISQCARFTHRLPIKHVRSAKTRRVKVIFSLSSHCHTRRKDANAMNKWKQHLFASFPSFTSFFFQVNVCDVLRGVYTDEYL